MAAGRSTTVFDATIADERTGSMTLRISGRAAGSLWADEPGGHRWQHIPGNERKGRVHTSTVTVAVMREPDVREVELVDRDLEWSFTRGSGAGGQNRNKVCSAVVLRHVPTGLTVRVETERSQLQNRQTALALLRSRLNGQAAARHHDARQQDRRQQVGSGQRGDKRRTVRQQDGQVHDHVTGQRWTWDRYRKGQW
jgi:peptide chain release factor 1